MRRRKETRAETAFRELRRALVRRRWQSIEPRLRVEVALLAVLVGGFLFWQARVPLEAIARESGPAVAAVRVAIGLGALAILGGWTAGVRHRSRLRAAWSGPSWLSLPLPPDPLLRHLAWESRAQSLWAAAAAPGLVAAAIGVVPLLVLVSIVIGFLALLVLSSRIACALALRTLRVDRGHAFRDPRVAVLSIPERAPARHGSRVVPWRRTRPWLALWWKDLRFATRGGTSRVRIGCAAALCLLAWLIWSVPDNAPSHSLASSLPFVRALAFAFALAAAAVFAEWLVDLAASDPPSVIKALPVGVASIWGARLAWAAGLALLLAATQMIAARGPGAFSFGIVVGVATLMIMILGVNYGITLFPHALAARRMLSLWLGLSMVVSLMIPLLGWVVLLSAVLHSTRRLPRWRWLEAE